MANFNVEETYPYINMWIFQDNDLEIFWDEETKSLIRAYMNEDLLWKSGENVQSLDQGLEELNKFLESTIYSEAEDFTAGWKHSD